MHLRSEEKILKYYLICNRRILIGEKSREKTRKIYVCKASIDDFGQYSLNDETIMIFTHVNLNNIFRRIGVAMETVLDSEHHLGEGNFSNS